MELILAILIVALLIGYAWWYNRLRQKAKNMALKSMLVSQNNWTGEFLESKRNIADPLADKVIEAVLAVESTEQLNNLFQIIRGNQQALPKGLLPELDSYFESTAVLPDWADNDMLNFGQRVYIQHGLFIGMLLFYKSLPECYTGAKGAEVLIRSARLNEKSGSQDHFSRRLAETGLFIYQAMMPGGFDANGKGIRAAQKIRLIHAVIRFYIKKKGWDLEKLGEPINQEDMAGTLMSFSALVLEGLEMIGVKFDDIERESYIHCWRVIGHIMGVDPELIPVNSKDALALGHAIIDHQKGESEAAKSLTFALLEFCDRKAPFFIKKDFHRKMMLDLMGEEFGRMLGLPNISTQKIKAFRNTIRFYIRVRELMEKVFLFGLPLSIIDRILLKLSIVYLSKNNLVSFYVPKNLTTDFENKK